MNIAELSTIVVWGATTAYALAFGAFARRADARRDRARGDRPRAGRAASSRLPPVPAARGPVDGSDGHVPEPDDAARTARAARSASRCR